MADHELQVTTTKLTLSLIWYRVRRTDCRLIAVLDRSVVKLVYNTHLFITSGFTIKMFEKEGCTRTDCSQQASKAGTMSSATEEIFAACSPFHLVL